MTDRCPMCGSKAIGSSIYSLGFVKLNLQEIESILYYLCLFYPEHPSKEEDLYNVIESLKSHRQGLKVRESLKDSKPLEPHEREIESWNIGTYNEDV